MLGAWLRRGRRTCRWIRAYPAARLEYMLADAAAAAMLAVLAQVLGGLPARRVPVLVLTDDPAVAAADRRGAGRAAPAGRLCRRAIRRT